MVADEFAGVGQTPGLQVWKIQNFSPVPVDKSEFGKFHEGDAYLVLRTNEFGGKLSWEVHFWLGKEASQDEVGAAAILAVELDDALGGAPVQYREAQEHESQLFLSHFPSGVRYLPGGVNSGFSHVTTNAAGGAMRLYQVKGRKNIRIKQVEPDVTAMNKGDSFILVSGNKLMVYHGSSAKRTERLRAVAAANQIRDQDLAGRGTVSIIDETSSSEEIQEFFSELGSGSAAEVPEEARGGDDVQFEHAHDAQVTLYRVSDESGELNVEKVAQQPLSQAALDSGDCFILDTVTSGLFVWVGRGATKAEKGESLRRAEEFLKSKNYSRWTRVTRVVQGGEPSTFKEYFGGWREEERLALARSRRFVTVQQVADTIDADPQSLDATKLNQLGKSGGAAFTFLPDAGDGEVQVFRVENFELAPLAHDKHGMFFGGDSYVIKYRYGGNRHIIYFWLGKESTQDEKAAAAIHSVRMDSELGGIATIVRVVQGSEPRHFNRIFQGKMIIFSGGHASGFRNLKDHDTYDEDGTRLFRIRGTEPEDVRAEQMPEVASSLDSDDVFLLETPSSNYLWFGKASNGYERDMARSLPMTSQDSPLELEEGQEPAEFWGALGGAKVADGDHDVPVIQPQLMHLSSDGSLDEVFHFTQKDLDSEDVFVLKSGDEVYVWLGSGACNAELQAAKKFCQACDAGVCILVHEGYEPRSFTSLFQNWTE